MTRLHVSTAVTVASLAHVLACAVSVSACGSDTPRAAPVGAGHGGAFGSGGAGAARGGSSAMGAASGMPANAGRSSLAGAAGAALGGASNGSAGMSGMAFGGAGAGAGGRASGTAGVGGASGGASASGGVAGMNGGAVAAGGASGGVGGASGAGAGGAGGRGGSSGVLAATPPMGWNSWNTFGCNLNEQLIKDVADLFVSSGMKDAGYEYVNLDDCWMDGRDSSGKLRWNTSKFPAGIPALAEYVHGKGLKIGIYETPNTRTCVGIYGGIAADVAVGSLGHETTDAQTFADWGIDYLKYDKCQGNLSAFAVMRDAIKAAARPIFFSINPGDGTGCPPNTCSINLLQTANMWRIGFDIAANWTSVVDLIDQNRELYSYAGPGHWNDPDMMEVGNGLNDTEGRSHFSMWAMMAAPLIAGNDLRKMSDATKTTLTNTEVIAVDQDALGKQGQRVATPASGLEVWSKSLTGTNARAVALFNRNSGNASISVQWSQLGLPAGAASVRDLWSHQDLGSFDGSFTASTVPGHGVTLLRIVSSP